MLKEKKELPKRIAWNGIAFDLPMIWEIDSLDTTHMIICEEGSPRIEIKWTDSPNRFTLEKYLKRFISATRKTLDITIHEKAHPPSFSHPNPDFEFFFFSWEGLASSGNGVLIFCSHCKKLTILRFFSGSDIFPGSLKAQIIASYSDHPKTHHVKWRIFGLHFSSPRELCLETYSFKPGAYMVKLRNQKRTLTIFSWGPASFLLSTTDLNGFARERIAVLIGFARTGTCSRGNTLEWSFIQEPFKGMHSLPFLNWFSLFTTFTICHDAKENRIIGVMTTSPVKYEQDVIQGVLPR